MAERALRMVGVGLVTAFLIWQFLVRPLFFYFKYKVQARPTIESCHPSELPEAVRENFDQCFAELSELKFRHCGTFTMPQAIKNLKSLFAVYENEQLSVVAVTTALFLKVNSEWRLNQQFASFGTQFPDGCDVDTLNVTDLFLYPFRPDWIRTLHPELRSMKDLFNAHVSMVEHHRNGRSSVSNFQTRYNSDVLRYYSESTFEELSYAESVGYLKLKQSQFENSDPGQQLESENPYRAPAAELIDQGSVFVPTLLGSFKVMWQVVWPVKPILGRIRLARDRKKLAETGYQWQ